MHDHDLDLIAEYAGGGLEDSSQAAELVMSCPECRAEYEAHKQVLVWLAQASSPQMTPDERRTLHDQVAAEVEGEAIVRQLSRTSRRVFVWAGAAAAVLITVLAIGPVFMQPISGVFSDISGRLPGADLEASATDGAATTAAAAPTAGAVEQGPTPSLGTGSQYVGDEVADLGVVTEDELDLLVRKGLNDSTVTAPEDSDYQPQCYQGLDKQPGDLVAWANYQRRPIEFYRSDAPERRLAAYYADDCTEVAP